MIRRYGMTALTVRDMETALGFYRDILGLKVIDDRWTHPDQKRTRDIEYCFGVAPLHFRNIRMLDPSGEVTVELHQFFSPLPQNHPEGRTMGDIGTMRMEFRVSDVEAMYNKLVSQGVVCFSTPVLSQHWAAFCCYDPDGNIVEFERVYAEPIEREGLIQRYGMTALTVRDMETSLYFYRDLLGLKVIDDRWTHPEEKRTRDIELCFGVAPLHFRNIRMLDPVGRVTVELHEFFAPLPKTHLERRTMGDIGTMRMELRAFDVDEAYQRLAAKGVKFISPPIHSEVGWVACCAYDPDGNIVELEKVRGE
ncbi:MAG: VOC family protein [Chloroflexi bacterium]|nr:VOC family protein [Chloroflexota bacterium]